MFNQTMMLLSSLMIMGIGEPGVPATKAELREASETPVKWTVAQDHRVDVAKFVREESKAAEKAGVTPIVYVGAKWCEPCLRFKKAVKRGRLKKELAGLHFLEFDLDLHRTSLESARYQSRMIPLFCLPDHQTGESSGQCMQGSVKGPGAIANIVPRLNKLLQSGAN